jgi:hypothetical protein
VGLRSKAGNREWASSGNSLAAFGYQTLSKSDYDRFLSSYITVQTDWAPKDFGKPNIEKFGAQSRMWTTRLTSCRIAEDQHQHRIVCGLRMDDAPEGVASAATAWPAELHLDLVLPKSEPVINVTFSWFGKRSNRLPEAMWLSFNPIAPQPENWMLSKVGGMVSPFDVVSGGNRHMHALSNGLSYRDDHGQFAIETLDAPLVVMARQSPIYFSNSPPDLSGGIHFSLFNNGWGTNYVQWFNDDMQFRFTLTV